MRGERFARAHAHYGEDVAYWLRNARRLGGPVLDLACASGRVAIPLARAGLEVVALDADADMLTEVERAAGGAGEDVRARVRTLRADMRTFALPSPVALAIVAMNSLQLLETTADRLACLRCVRDHLAPAGELHFDVSLPDLADVAASLGVVRQVAAWSDDHGSVVHWASYADFDPVTQTVTLQTIVDVTDADGRLTRDVQATDVHLYQPCELELLLELAGFDIIEVAGGFAGEPLEPGAERQVYACRPREAVA